MRTGEMDNDSLSIKQMTAILDSMPVAVYVFAVDTQELLYANGPARKMLPDGADSTRLTCYQIAGCDRPCTLCQTDHLDRDNLFVREFNPSEGGCIYELSGKIIDWEGRSAHVEYVKDITERKKGEVQTTVLKRELKDKFGGIPCGLCIYHYDGNSILSLYHNDVFFELMRHFKENISHVERNEPFVGIHPDDEALLRKKVMDILHGEGTIQHTYRSCDGAKKEHRWIQLEGSVKVLPDGTKNLYGVFSDISEQKRLQLYFKTVVDKLPGGISVIRCEPDGRMIPEFVSDGFAAMTHMTAEEAVEMCNEDIFYNIHPDDVPQVSKILYTYMESGEGHCEFTARFKMGGGGYIWVKDTLSLLDSADGVCRIYSVYTDVTKTVEEKERLLHQYEDIILQHYRMAGPDELVLGHCNISRNVILEIRDRTDSNLLETFGYVREEFFKGIAGLITDEEERRIFLETFLNEPELEAFRRNVTEQELKCLIRLPKETKGRYVRFRINLIEMPDTGDIVGILTVTDITQRTITDRILHQLSASNYDYVLDVDLLSDSYTVLACDKNAHGAPPFCGSFSERVRNMARSVVPKDRERYTSALNETEIRRRLREQSSYTFFYSITDEKGENFAKNMTVSDADLRIGRVSMVCSDITESVRAQQGLLNMIAYTFELACFINIAANRLTMHTRQTVLENLSPYIVEHYDEAAGSFAQRYGAEEEREEVNRQFMLETMIQRLKEKPGGYDFVFSYRQQDDILYKQINVLWGDEDHTTVCLVRADVTDMLKAEREAKKALENALELAQEASQAKGDFLSAMSHDIRTPMNAIMGMTALAVAHIEQKERVADCLQKISVASRHLLSLINDVLDMNKIERSKITLNRVKISLEGLTEQLSAIMSPQAREAGLSFGIRMEGIKHNYFYGDFLRINQIMINILSNSIKFTQPGGEVEFVVEETEPSGGEGHIGYCFTIRDTGIGIPEEFLNQLFAPFARSRDSARIEGTGLGLCITKGLVELMGGSITVESHINEGSVFRVEIEFETAGEDGASAGEDGGAYSDDRAKQERLSGLNFLIAEDNEINAEILSELLSMYGGRCNVLTDGAQAAQAFKDAAPGTYDAILMDIQMPEMNGYEATRVIRAMDRADAAQIPIVAMTANAFSEDIRAALDVGMNAHVAKPVDMDVLLETLQKVLPRKK